MLSLDEVLKCSISRLELDVLKSSVINRLVYYIVSLGSVEYETWLLLLLLRLLLGLGLTQLGNRRCEITEKLGKLLERSLKLGFQVELFAVMECWLILGVVSSEL